jgi:formamidopyrimidine-DNA glycosylase
VPELPEVETVVRCLRPALVGRRFRGVQVTGKPLRRKWNAASTRLLLAGPEIHAVERRGKWILIRLSTADCMLVHLGMTGRLQVVASGQPLATHTHLVFPLAPGDGELRFRDPRRFGSLEIMSSQALAAFLERRLGPEPFDLAPESFAAALGRTRRCLKAALLDQRVVAGLGNIYADEALFQARLSPFRRASGVRRRDADALLRAIRRVLVRAIEKKGSTIRDYMYDENGQGGYQTEFRVYQRTGAPCRQCRRPICRAVLGGRSTHYCPACQRVARSRVKPRQAALAT